MNDVGFVLIAIPVTCALFLGMAAGWRAAEQASRWKVERIMNEKMEVYEWGNQYWRRLLVLHKELDAERARRGLGPYR